MSSSYKMEKFWQRFTRKDWNYHKIGQFLFDILFIQGTEQLYITKAYFNNQLNTQFLYTITIYMLHYNSRHVSSIKPIRSYVGPRPTSWFSCSAPMLEDVRHVFVAPALLSEPVWRFSSCRTDFGQQRAQLVLFLFLGRPRVLMWTRDCASHSRGCACRKTAGMKGVNK